MKEVDSFRALLCVLAASFAFAATSAPAQTYPTRPVRVILPFAAGGIADITTRLIADKLGDKLGQRIIVDNQPGAGGIAAARSVLAAPRRRLHARRSSPTAPRSACRCSRRLPFDPVKDFAPISGSATFDLASR